MSVGSASDLTGDVEIEIDMAMAIVVLNVGVFPASRQVPVVQLFTGNSVNSVRAGTLRLDATTLCRCFHDSIYH